MIMIWQVAKKTVDPPLFKSIPSPTFWDPTLSTHSLLFREEKRGFQYMATKLSKLDINQEEYIEAHNLSDI